MTDKLKMPKLKLDLEHPHTRELSKKVLFIDIETSLVEARVFRTGQQQINANQLTTNTKILTVAGGSLYDMWIDKEYGMWSCSNHRSSTFKDDPLDDTEVLALVWEELDNAKVVVAHNASFDRGWLMGRFLQLGWKLPSKFFLFCTYRNLTPFTMNSKKLNELSKTLIGEKKIDTTYDLWCKCSEGDVESYKKMEAYNLGDIYSTLFKLWVRTAYYNPHKSIDFSDISSGKPTCRVDGSILLPCGEHHNKSNGLYYNLYINKRAGIQYIDRHNKNSKKAGKGYVRPFLGY